LAKTWSISLSKKGLSTKFLPRGNAAPWQIANSKFSESHVKNLESTSATNRQTKNSLLTVPDIVDDSIVRELEKDGFIDRLYRKEEQ